MEPLLMDLKNSLFLEGGEVVIIDRRKLPREIVRVVCRDYEEVARAIEDMVIQGAGDIAIAAGYGMYLAALEKERKGLPSSCLEKAAERLRRTRPTGFHLSALVAAILKHVAGAERPSGLILNYLGGIFTKQRRISEETGRHAETLLVSGDRILTHCFAGAGLLFMLKFARDNGKDIRVICTETRPYLQGARLTSWSVSRLGIDTTLITDNMAGHFMSRGEVTKVFTAADRIAMDGSAANKVGTLQLAICARHFNIPFYILGYGGPDRNTLRGEEVVIEQRDPREVLEINGKPISAPGIKAAYPAFDVTPAELITGIITCSGVKLRSD